MSTRIELDPKYDPDTSLRHYEVEQWTVVRDPRTGEEAVASARRDLKTTATSLKEALRGVHGAAGRAYGMRLAEASMGA